MIHKSLTSLFAICLLTVLLVVVSSSCITIKLPKSDIAGDSSYAYTKPEPKMIPWEYDKLITNPIKATSNTKTVSLGDIQSQQVKVIVFGTSFDTETQLTAVTPQNVPEINSNEFLPIGVPVDISSGSSQRLNLPATIFMKIDTDKQADDLKKGNIWIAYYNGTEWDYFKPDNIDFDKGEIYFSTYHFCIFGWGKIDAEEQIEQYIHSKVVASTLQSDVIDEMVNTGVKNLVEDILRDKLGIDDESQVGKVMASLANDDEYRELLEKVNANDVEGFYQDFSIFVGKKIAENVDESVFSSALENLTDAELLTAASQAAGHLAEGQYLEAGKILGGQIADQFMVTKVAKGAIEVTQYNIDKWKDAEVEAAYQAFKNGASSKFWGYNVDAGKFDDLWNQMRGLAIKLQSDAVQNEIKRRGALSMREATDTELDALRSKVAKDLKTQFEKRVKEEAKIEQEEARLAKLVKAYQDNHLMTNLEFGYEDIMSVEHRLDSLLKIRDRILRDTGRKGWNFSSVSNNIEVGIGDLLSLTKAWFSDTTGEKYAKELKSIFGIDLNKKKSSASQKGAMGSCDLTIEPESLEGEVGIQYAFQAITGLKKNVSFDWYIDGKKVKSGNVTSISPTFKVDKTFTISVTMFENKKEVCTAKSTAVIKKKAEQQPAVKPVQPETPKGGGWYQDGAPVITKKDCGKPSDFYPSCGITVSSGSSTGFQTWYDFNSPGKCGGTYTGTITWTPPPAYLKPGDKYLPNLAAQITEQNSCGSLSMGAWVSIQTSIGGLNYDCNSSSKPCSSFKDKSFTVPEGTAGQKLAIDVSCHPVNLGGYCTYNYVYK